MVPSMASLLAAVLCGGSVVAQTVIPPATPDFAAGAVQSDEYEIQAAQDALAQSRNPDVRTFAEAMIRDHGRSQNEVRDAATASGLPPPPPAMNGEQAAMLSALQGLRLVEFDRAYARQQVLAHQQALAVEQSYASEGADPNVRRAAQTTVPMIQHHLKMAQQMKAALER
jgi:putative membrane protein